VSDGGYCYRRASSNRELQSPSAAGDSGNTGNTGNTSGASSSIFEDAHPERTKMNHHITLSGLRPPEGLSSSGLPAVRMSTLSNIVLPSTFHFEPLEDTTAVSFTQAGGHSDTFRSNGPVLDKKVVDREAKFYEEALEGRWPVVMDLKMGFQSVENTEPSLLKRLRHTALDHLTGSKHSGVRLEGLSMYRTEQISRSDFRLISKLYSIISASTTQISCSSAAVYCSYTITTTPRPI